MATYGQFYYKVLQKISNDYLNLHNLTNLDQLQHKIKCYTQHNAKPHAYYECFRQIQRQREVDSAALGRDYIVIEDQYKLCSQGCKQLKEGDFVNCTNTCGNTFSQSIKTLYDNFYRRKVGNRKEYRKVKS